MTVAAYSTNLSNIIVEFPNTTGWTAIGTGGAGLNAPETDYFIQGNNCISKNAFASSVKGMIYDSSSDQGGSGTDGAYIAWLTHAAPNSLDTKAGGGLRFLIGSSSSAYREFYVGGSDTMTFQGWEFIAVNEASTADNTTGSPTTGVEQTFGALWDLPSGGPTKGAPNGIDAIRFGRCDIVIEHGTGADPAATLSGVLTNLETASNRYGLLAQRKPGGAFENSGLIVFGTATNAVRFDDSNKIVFLRAHDHVTANFNTWEVRNASSAVTFTNLVVKSLGGASRGRWVSTDNATLTWSGCSFIDLGTFGFLAAATVDACTFLRCDAITLTGAAALTNCVIEDTNVAADSAALVWNVASSPASKLAGTEFVKGSAATHAIEFGTSAPQTMTLTDITFTGYNASNGQNDSTLAFADTGSNVTWNVTISGGTTPSYKKRRAGDTVNIITGQTTVTLTGLVSGTEVRVYDAGDGSVIDGIESSGTSFAFSDTATNVVDIRIFHVDYLEADIEGFTIPGSNTSIPVQQVFDRNYNNP